MQNIHELFDILPLMAHCRKRYRVHRNPTEVRSIDGLLSIGRDGTHHRHDCFRVGGAYPRRQRLDTLPAKPLAFSLWQAIDGDKTEIIQVAARALKGLKEILAPVKGSVKDRRKCLSRIAGQIRIALVEKGPPAGGASPAKSTRISSGV
jgi:hypothetical protein